MSPEKRRLLSALAEAGVDVPEGAQIWSGDSGHGWRLVDWRGAELGVSGDQPVRLMTGTVTVTGGLARAAQPD